MRSELNTLQLSNAKNDATLREVRGGFEGSVTNLEAQVMECLKSQRVQFEQVIQEQHRRLSSEIATLEHFVLEHKAATKAELDAERSVRQPPPEDRSSCLGEELDISGIMGSVDARIETRLQALHEEMFQQHSALQDRLSTHEEHRLVAQASLESVGGGLREELRKHASVMDDHRSCHAASLLELELKMQNEMSQQHDAIRACLSRHDENQSGLQLALEAVNRDVRAELGALAKAADEQYGSEKSGHAASLRDLEHKLQAEMFRAQEEQEVGVKDLGEGLRKAHHLKLDELERRLRSEVGTVVAEVKAEQLAQRKDLEGHRDAGEAAVQRHLEEADAGLRALRLDLQQPASVARAEFDDEIHRLWQAIDTHQHNPFSDPGKENAAAANVLPQEA